MSEILNDFHEIQELFGVKLNSDDEMANFNSWLKGSYRFFLVLFNIFLQ